MTNARRNIGSLCDQALERVDLAIERHRNGQPEDLNIQVLQQIREEIEQMKAALDKSRFQPGYGRFILDWPDDHGLVEFLLNVAHRYSRVT